MEEKKKGFTVITKGDVDRHEKRMAEGGGIQEVIEAQQFPAARVKNRVADPKTKCDRAMTKIENFVRNRPEHAEAGFKTRADFERHFGTIAEKTKHAQQQLPDHGGLKLKGRIPSTVLRRRCREAGGMEVLKDQKEARKLFKDWRWD